MHKQFLIFSILSILLTPEFSKAQEGVSTNFLCPNIEGTIFRCPTIPTVQAGLDVETDAIGGGVEMGCRQNHGGVCIAPGIEYGRGNESFGGFKEEYSVLQVKVHGRYSFPMNADSSATISPLAGPRFYRFSYIDCPFESGCSENLFVLDVGAGFQYKNFGVDVFTGLNGPDLYLRLKYLFGY